MTNQRKLQHNAVSMMTCNTLNLVGVIFWLMLFSSQQPSMVKSMIVVSKTNQRRRRTTQTATTTTRRDFLDNFGTVISTIPPAAAVAVASSVVVRPEAAIAAATQDEASSSSSSSGLLDVSDVAKLLKPIPTFVIVDKLGVPYFVVGEDAKVTGYFFTSYKEASRILSVAKTSADKSIAESKRELKTKNKKLSKEEMEEEIGTNPWKEARISTVPLDFAVTLTTKSNAMKRGGTYFQVAPSEVDIEDALQLTGQNSLAEGKVPLFYDEDFTIIDDVDGQKKTPLFFRKEELEEAFSSSSSSKQQQRRDLQISVTELFAVITELVKPGGSDMDLKSLMFVAPKGSQQKKLECEKKGGNAPPFVFGQRNIIL